jgi:hypothetical protein
VKDKRNKQNKNKIKNGPRETFLTPSSNSNPLTFFPKKIVESLSLK